MQLHWYDLLSGQSDDRFRLAFVTFVFATRRRNGAVLHAEK
jgi:hypothetical protein